jgi:hypothetical protein
MRSRRSGEEGVALLVVMVLMGVMLTTGIAIVSTVDTQTSASQAERVRDSAFNLAESSLNAQVFGLSRDWPGSLPRRYDLCTPTSSPTRCPDNASLVGGGSPDLTGATWQTSVRDNGNSSAPNFYSDASSATQPGYDANLDGKVWVRAQAVAQGHARTLIALVRTEKQEEDIPHAAVLANRLVFSNNAPKKVFVAAGNGLFALRCDPLADPRSTCLGRTYTGTSPAGATSSVAGNITGSAPTTSYAGGPAITPEALARLKATAIANGTYYDAGCPTEAQLTGQVVYVVSGNCSYNSNSQFNSPQAPGMLILDRGTISISGTANFYGVIYALANGLTGTVVSTQGTGQIVGGVLVDGLGQVVLGSSSSPKIQFDVNAFRAVASYGAAGIVQNTWREIRAG